MHPFFPGVTFLVPGVEGVVPNTSLLSKFIPLVPRVEGVAPNAPLLSRFTFLVSGVEKLCLSQRPSPMNILEKA